MFINTTYLAFNSIFFFINPKLKNPGAYLHIKTNIYNAHVYLDEKYLGRTPLNKYINVTKGTLRIKRLGFDTYEKQIEIQNKFLQVIILMSP